MPKWPSMPVSYWINERGSPQLSNGSEIAAIHSSFQTWANVASANVRAVYRGTTPVTGVGHDGMNVISFTDASTPLGSSTIAATFSFFKSEIGGDGLIHLVIDEADVLFNPALGFSTSADDSKFDIQSILTHELGHFLGLDHSALVSSVMGPFGVTGVLDQRTLAYDDIAGITEMYPTASSIPGGRIQGTVRSGTAGVFGANVVAIDADGTSLVTTLSQADGSYVLRFLPPGVYRVLAEPMDLPVSKDHIGGFYAGIRTDFGSTYFGNVANLADARTVTVTANGTSNADILTLPKGTTGLNLTRPGFGVRVARGRSVRMTIGGEDITSGVGFTASNSGLFLGPPTFGGRISAVAPTSASMDLAISSTTPLGPKNIAVSRGADVSILTGGLVITDTTPSNIGVAPGNGPIAGGTPVTITGLNFRAGAQVYFGGLAASGVNVIDSGTILANVPANSPGAANVVVMNADGTWGSAPRAFTYNASPPVITRVTPLIGPPATVVTIEGDNFDSLVQNVSVQFNGSTARVISASSKVIIAIVPYGATTGPISISVFGQSITGPVFNVSATPTSTNLAKGAFNFIDAGVASGGTNLTFSNVDDAVALFPLPFVFSLFRDIYLPDSQVSITTNGFLSLESLSTAEFQNGALPGQTIARPSGTTGVIPPSLIAAFWDDLIMKSTTAITTRTVGNAPNRQFVVQWSDISILDEDGNDLNASLTFEIVLYEGSNDIQFMYRTMTGLRSDGSSATIGFQDLKRTSAIQVSFNQPIVSAEYVKTYHFDNGSYVEVAPDNTAPSTPLVTDEGLLTANRSQLGASWTAIDLESGIREFQYAVGTTPGGTDVKPFTSTTQNSIMLTGLSLQAGTTYYFAVKAINGVGLASAVGISDGIRFDPAYVPQIKIIPSAPQSSSEFSGLALLAPTAMTVVLRAYDATGAPILGSGVRNPTTITMAAGQQYAKLLSELFGLATFDGWVEVEASAPGLGIFTATGAWNMSTLDGSVARDASTDFVLFHSGASATFVNPSTRTANVTMTSMTTQVVQSFTIPARGMFVTTLSSTVRVQSSEALAAIERVSGAGKLAINAAVPVTDAQSTYVFPHAVIGGGYRSTLTLANVATSSETVTYGFGGLVTSVTLQPNTSIRVPILNGLGLNTLNLTTGAVTGFAAGSVTEPSKVVGVLDIENESGSVTIGARPAATDFAFPHVANGNGLFTGLALATGADAARITIDVYPSSGGTPKSSTFTLAANQQLARLVSELVAGTETQVGGYIRIRSDQPIFAWEIYGSGEVMASGPPL
jgi:hypothetical protein